MAIDPIIAKLTENATPHLSAQFNKKHQHINTVECSTRMEITQKLVEIHRVGLYTQLPPADVVVVHQQLRTHLATHMNDLSEAEYYDLIELGFYLALIMGKDTEARNCVLLLTDKFGEDQSPRIAVLRATLLHATKGTQEAIDLLGERDEDELLSLKKRVALSKGDGLVKYVDALLGFLDIAPLDVEAWAELGETYYQLGHLDKAIWAYQEVLIVQPFNYYAFARIGELERALCVRNKGKDDLKASVKHFARSVELCATFVRGWAGLFVTAKGENEKLYKLANKQLEAIVEDEKAAYGDIVLAKKILAA